VQPAAFHCQTSTSSTVSHHCLTAPALLIPLLHLLCSSGIDMGEGASCDLYVLDTATATWSALQPNTAATTASSSSSSSGDTAPPARSYHAMAAAGGKLYVFGGCGAAGRLADLWQFDPAAGAWCELPGCGSVGARGGSVMVAAGDGRKLFVMGGFNGDGEERSRLGAEAVQDSGTCCDLRKPWCKCWCQLQG
jgi:hypothetical protein